MQTITTALQEGRTLWDKANADICGLEAILCSVLKCSKEDLFKNPNKFLDEKENRLYMESIRRLHAGEPLSLIINRKEFYGLDFYIDKRVLTPRPETELIVDLVLDLVKKGIEINSILDIGTGSGCIAVALAKSNCGLQVTASDISKDALDVAIINAKSHDVHDRMDFIESDLLSKVAGEFDVIVSNLPYIGTKKYNFISKDVAEYEPEIALFGGHNGLSVYKRLFKQVSALKSKPKYMIGEFGFLQADDVRKMIEDRFPGGKYQIINDLASIERVFMINF
jgi:release factor glutamine methyltransferase